MTTGEKIKKRRQELHMTVDMLAEAIHKNRATIYRYENNEIKSIPLVDLEPLANALGLDPMYLAGISAEPAPAPRDGYKPRAVARLEEMRLTPEMDAKIVAMLDILVPEEDVKNDQT